MTSNNALQNTSPSANELLLARVFNAPCELVYKAWTDPKHMLMWWGPKGSKVTTHSGDFRENGEWLFTISGPGNMEYSARIRFIQLTPSSHITYTHNDAEETEQSNPCTVTIDLTEQDGKTHLNMKMAFASTPNPYAEAGANHALLRLEEYILTAA